MTSTLFQSGFPSRAVSRSPGSGMASNGRAVRSCSFDARAACIEHGCSRQTRGAGAGGAQDDGARGAYFKRASNAVRGNRRGEPAARQVNLAQCDAADGMWLRPGQSSSPRATEFFLLNTFLPADGQRGKPSVEIRPKTHSQAQRQLFWYLRLSFQIFRVLPDSRKKTPSAART